MRGHSLSRRIAASLTLVLLLGVLATYAWAYLDTHGTYEPIQARTMQEQARELISALDSAPNQPPETNLSAAWREVYARADSGYYYSIYDRGGRIRAVSENLRTRVPLPLTDGPTLSQRWGSLHFLGPQSNPALTARARSGDFIVVARERVDREALAESLVEERSEPIFVFVLFALFALLIIFIVTRRTLKPLEAASAQAALVGPGYWDARIEAEGLPSELRPLVDAFNQALDRLARAYEIEKRITANAAHELRTPLTVLSLRLQRARLGEHAIDWQAVQDDLARMTRLVSQLLDLARKEAQHAPIDSPVNLSRIAREGAAAVLPLAEAEGRLVTVEAPLPLWSRGNADDLRDMIRNLIENALVHGEGTVEVTVAELPGAEPATAQISVSDEGKGLSHEEREQLFERFHKGRQSSGGSGLGLAIVRQVAHHHGGDARFSPGTRTQVEVLLPLHERKS